MNDLIALMMEQARQALNYAYAPYSKYKVSACICSKEDNFYTGVNVENASYGLSICAESSALCHMVSAGEQTIKMIVIMNALNTLCSPCGACRQRLIEFSTSETKIYFCDQQNILQPLFMNELLPHAFKFNWDKK